VPSSDSCTAQEKALIPRRVPNRRHLVVSTSDSGTSKVVAPMRSPMVNLTPRKFLHREHEPREELIVRLYGGARAPGMIAHQTQPRKLTRPGASPLDPRGKDVKILRSNERPPAPEAEAAAPENGGAPVAVGRPEALWIEVPGTAADDTLAVSARPRRAVLRCSLIIFVIAILGPLPDVAVHVI